MVRSCYYSGAPLSLYFSFLPFVVSLKMVMKHFLAFECRVEIDVRVKCFNILFVTHQNGQILDEEEFSITKVVLQDEAPHLVRCFQ